MQLDLEGRVALVTGVSRGIGAAVASSLLAEGVRVVGVSRTTPDDLDPRVRHQQADLTTPEAPERVVAETLAEHRRLDVLVNNIGGGQLTPGFTDLDDEAWNRMLDLNLMAAVRTTRAALPALVESSGVVVNMSSINGHLPSSALHVYNVAKAGLDVLTAGLAQEYAARGVRVVGVAPGPVDTPLWLGDEGAGQMIADMTGRTREEVIEGARASLPMGRFATAEEVADLVTFLASPRAASISGTTVRIDGAATPTV